MKPGDIVVHTKYGRAELVSVKGQTAEIRLIMSPEQVKNPLDRLDYHVLLSNLDTA